MADGISGLVYLAREKPFAWHPKYKGLVRDLRKLESDLYDYINEAFVPQGKSL